MWVFPAPEAAVVISGIEAGPAVIVTLRPAGLDEIDRLAHMTRIPLLSQEGVRHIKTGMGDDRLTGIASGIRRL